ncbi:hypothetical protein LIER_35891 [Lithospermum erythrorhizon]|uniref:Uncharacterized protein n=1 Tax=Lithospermum erythrorhizon TaxID=34254 RepID=A0AAV3NYP0_LITER
MFANERCSSHDGQHCYALHIGYKYLSIMDGVEDLLVEVGVVDLDFALVVKSVEEIALGVGTADLGTDLEVEGREDLEVGINELGLILVRVEDLHDPQSLKKVWQPLNLELKISTVLTLLVKMVIRVVSHSTMKAYPPSSVSLATLTPVGLPEALKTFSQMTVSIT